MKLSAYAVMACPEPLQSKCGTRHRPLSCLEACRGIGNALFERHSTYGQMFTVNNASGNCGSKWEDGDAAYPYLCHAYLIQPSAAICMVHRKRNSATSNRTSLVAPPLRSLHLHTVHMPRSPRESAKAHTLYNLVSTFAMLPSESVHQYASIEPM